MITSGWFRILDYISALKRASIPPNFITDEEPKQPRRSLAVFSPDFNDLHRPGARRSDAPTVPGQLERFDAEDARDCRSGLLQFVAPESRQREQRVFRWV